MSAYKNRVADEILKDNLEAAGLVLIEGTKWCGKTTTYKRKDGIWVVPIGCLKP